MSGKNTGTTKINNFSFPDVRASYVRVKSFHTNINHSWNAMSCALTFTHSVSLKGGHPTAEETRTGPIAVLVHSYLMQFEIQTAPGCQKL